MNGPTKECPYCATQIPTSAAKCPNCREWLDKNAAARARPGPSIRWDGDKVLFPKGASATPRQCLICGGEDAVKPWRKQFVYTPPWVYIVVIAALLPGAILAMIVQKRDTLTLSRCGPCRRRMILMATLGWTIGVIGLFAFPIIGGVLGEMIDKHDGQFAGIMIGLGLWFAFLIFLAIWHTVRGVSCKLIDERSVTLKFPKPDITRRVLPMPTGEVESGGWSS